MNAGEVVFGRTLSANSTLFWIQNRQGSIRTLRIDAEDREQTGQLADAARWSKATPDEEADPYDAILAELAATLTGGTLETNAQKISEIILNTVTDLNWAGLYFLDRNKLRRRASSKVAGIGPHIISLNGGVCGAVARDGQLRNIPDVTKWPGYIDGRSSPPTQSELALALKDDAGRVVAVLNLESPRLERFSKDDEDGCTAIAAWLAKWQRQHGNIFPPRPSARATEDAATTGKFSQSDVKTEENKPSTIFVGKKERLPYYPYMDERMALLEAVAKKENIPATILRTLIDDWKATRADNTAHETRSRAAVEPCGAIEETTQHAATPVAPPAKAQPVHETTKHTAMESHQPVPSEAGAGFVPELSKVEAIAIEDSTLVRQWHKYQQLLAKVALPPDGRFKTLEEARAGRNLENTYRAARARQEKLGVALVPKNDKYISKVSSAAATFYQRNRSQETVALG